MTTIAAALGRAVRLDGDGRGRFEAGAELAGWPGTVHGGTLAAALDEAGRRLGGGDGPRRIEARLTASVPIASALALEGEARDGGAAVSLVDRGQPVSMATMAVLDAPGAAAPAPATAPAPWCGNAAGFTLPTSETCLACGAGNSLGLRLALAFDDEGVWVRTAPRAGWRAAGGLHPALAPVVLDEVAWWLGALAMREGGLTNRIAVDLLDPCALVDAGAEIAAAGRFADVVAVDRRKTFWRTAVALTGPAGRSLARATIVFRGGAEYSERQIPYFRPRTPSDVFRRMFPNHA
jgi:hypothetical protein